MAVYKCKICGGTMEFDKETDVSLCSYCGMIQTVPKLCSRFCDLPFPRREGRWAK